MGKIPAAFRSQGKYGWLTLSLLAAGAGLRFYALGDQPAGFNQDEATIGYEAWSLLHFGRDMNGHSWPVIFETHGGVSVAYAHFAMPFIWLGGLTPFFVRLPMACFSFVSLILMWRIARNAEGPKFACVALLFLAFNAWHVMAGRWALEGNLAPFVILSGVYFLSRRDVGALRVQLAAVILLSLSVYAYATAYVFAPAFLALVFCWLALNGAIDRRRALALAAAAFAAALPIMLLLAVNLAELDAIEFLGVSIPNFSGRPRYEMVSFLFSGATAEDLALNVARLAWYLAGGTAGLHELGVFAPLAVVPFGFGLATTLHRAATRRDYGFHLLIACWVVAALVPIMLTPVNVNRANLLWPPAVYMMALGVFRACRRPAALCGALSLYLAAGALFVNDYFRNYDSLNGEKFYVGLGSAIKSVLASPDRGAVYVSERVAQPHVFLLFYGEMPMTQYLSTRTIAGSRVASFDRFHFDLGCREAVNSCILHHSEIPDIETGRFTLERHGLFYVARRRSGDDG